MKVRVEIEDTLKENEVIIRCNEYSKEVEMLKEIIQNQKANQIVFMKEDKEYYLSLDEILFFETDSNFVQAHTINEVFRVKYRLYELEKILPFHFMRIAKSTVVNLNKIYSVQFNIASSSLIEFYQTYKQVYASRTYYKILKQRLGKRN